MPARSDTGMAWMAQDWGREGVGDFPEVQASPVCL